LFVKATDEGTREVNSLLDKRINFDKSSVFFSKGCPEGRRQSVKNILSVPNETPNEKYLGMPSDIGRLTNGAFKYLKDRIWKKIQGWLEQTLASGGKEVLIKLVAMAISTFSMSCFRFTQGLMPSHQCNASETMVGKQRWQEKNQLGHMGDNVFSKILWRNGFPRCGAI
jgi:hypothetical protein